jgi:hypothetical protein
MKTLIATFSVFLALLVTEPDAFAKDKDKDQDKDRKERQHEIEKQRRLEADRRANGYYDSRYYAPYRDGADMPWLDRRGDGRRRR